MSHSMSMGGSTGVECKISMLWNWYTIDACFLASSWHIKTRGMFAASCIGVALLVVCLEFLRRIGKEYDSYILRQYQRRVASLQYQPRASYISPKSKEVQYAEGCGPDASCAPPLPKQQFITFRATPAQQIMRGIIHAATFGVGYLVMLMAMYFNGFIILSIILGAFLGKVLCDWMVVRLPMVSDQEFDGLIEVAKGISEPTTTNTEKEDPSRLKELILRCTTCDSTCCCQLGIPRAWGINSTLHADDRCCNFLKTLLQEYDITQESYRRWTREELKKALKDRKIWPPNVHNKDPYRTALEIADKNRQFAFMNLPKDIRMMVYDYALSFDKVQKWCSPLLCTGRAIREEGSATFFRLNRFRLHIFQGSLHFKTMSWLHSIGPNNISNLRQVLIVVDGHEAVEIDLRCKDASKWTFVMDEHSRFSCLRRNPETLDVRFERWANFYLADNDRAAVAKRRQMAPHASNFDAAQKIMDDFVDACGEGKGVRPTIAGLRQLACCVFRVKTYAL